MQEWWLDETNIGSSVLPAFGAAYLRATTGGRLSGSEPYLMSRGNPYGTDSFPKVEHLARAMWVVANGAVPPISFGWPGHRETAQQVLQEVARREPWLTDIEDLPWAALLVSEQTRQFYAYRNIPGIFLPPLLGVFRTAFEEHLPLALINDWDLAPESLDRFRVVVLANAAALSEAQAQAVKDHVRRGGGLVVTGDTSLCDELGRPRSDFALADVMGTSYRGRPAQAVASRNIDANFAITLDETYWNQRTGSALVRWDDHPLWSDERLAALVPHRAVRFRGPGSVIAAPEGTEVVATFQPDGGERIPAVTTQRFGEGRVVYFAADLAAGYWSYSYPYQRRMLRRALEWAAGTAPPIAVHAPMNVQTTFFQQRTDAGRRWIVHRYNGVNSTAGHGLPTSEVPLREEIVPISGIALELPGPRPSRVTLQPQNRAVAVESKADRHILNLPPLELHDLVVIEWDE
jgi:hypothetical protein